MKEKVNQHLKNETKRASSIMISRNKKEKKKAKAEMLCPPPPNHLASGNTNATLLLPTSVWLLMLECGDRESGNIQGKLMGRGGPKLPGFCLNRIRPHVKVRSPSLQSKPNNHEFKCGRADDENGGGDDAVKDVNAAGRSVDDGRRIMIVVDSSLEAKGALQWALSHTVQSHDTIILLHVTKPSPQALNRKEEEPNCKVQNPKGWGPVHSMKTMCKQRRPEVMVEVSVVEGEEKGPTILGEAKKQRASLIVLGQRKRSMTWRLVMMWSGHRTAVGGGGAVDYCIQNAECMALAVRKKSKKGGGYLITTKRQKDFWLLA